MGYENLTDENKSFLGFVIVLIIFLVLIVVFCVSVFALKTYEKGGGWIALDVFLGFFTLVSFGFLVKKGINMWSEAPNNNRGYNSI